MHKPTISEKKGQPTWVDKCLPDLRVLGRELRSHAVEEVPASDSHTAAINLVAEYLGLSAHQTSSRVFSTPVGDVTISFANIFHIVEKRPDARERYIPMALDTLIGPFEVWKVAFTDDSYRLAFIGIYESKRQMLVSVAMRDGLLLWNFMQCDAKSLNKHRHGELLYQRYCSLEDKEKGSF